MRQSVKSVAGAVMMLLCACQDRGAPVLPPEGVDHNRQADSAKPMLSIEIRAGFVYSLSAQGAHVEAIVPAEVVRAGCGESFVVERMMLFVVENFGNEYSRDWMALLPSDVCRGSYWRWASGQTSASPDIRVVGPLRETAEPLLKLDLLGDASGYRVNAGATGRACVATMAGVADIPVRLLLLGLTASALCAMPDTVPSDDRWLAALGMVQYATLRSFGLVDGETEFNRGPVGAARAFPTEDFRSYRWWDVQRIADGGTRR